MKNKLVWFPGVPSDEGVYWFDNGLRGTPGCLFNRRRPLVLEVRKNNKYVFGAGGSCPLSMVYSHEKLHDVAKYAHIPAPERWQDLHCITKKTTPSWIKDKNNTVGFGIFDPGAIGVGVAWLGNKQCAFEGDGWYRGKDWLFGPIKYPVLV